MKRYKRWISIGCNDPWMRTLRKARQLHTKIISGGKPGMVAWYGICLEAKPEQMRQLQAWWDESKIEWYKKMPQGAWDVPSEGDPLCWKKVMSHSRQRDKR